MSDSPKTIWLLSAYRSASHGAWADWLLEQFPENQWQRLELPGRHFRWRIRGNPLSWLHMLPKQPADLIIASSMVDLATLKGLHPQLTGIPCLYYFHENQFAYPANSQQHQSIDPQMVQLYGALAADKVLFNSHYNQSSFIQGINQLLNKLPDAIPANVAQMIEKKSQVLPVAIETMEQEKQGQNRNPQLILWNHRWEYDKSPEVFVEALKKLQQQGINFQLALLGERAESSHPALQEIEQQFASHILVNGRVERQLYKRYLAQAGIVVSTAIHEFQGLAMLEAVSAGATPVAPDSLCYPEQYPKKFLYKATDSESLANKLTTFLQQPESAPNVSVWYSENMKIQWAQTIQQALLIRRN